MGCDGASQFCHLMCDTGGEREDGERGEMGTAGGRRVVRAEGPRCL